MGDRMIEVVVDGRLAPELAAALEGFSVTAAAGGRTKVIGTIPDQARLFGLLEMFEALNIAVISVNTVGAQPA